MADLLEDIGLGRERIRMVNLSSAMAVQFAEEIKGMTEAVRELGANPLREPES